MCSIFLFFWIVKAPEKGKYKAEKVEYKVEYIQKSIRVSLSDKKMNEKNKQLTLKLGVDKIWKMFLKHIEKNKYISIAPVLFIPKVFKKFVHFYNGH